MINTWDFTTEGLCRAAIDICLWRGPQQRTIFIPAYRPIPQGASERRWTVSPFIKTAPLLDEAA